MIKYFKPYLPSPERDLRKIIKSGWLTSGKYVERLEAKIENLTGDYCLAISSATMGLVMASRLYTGDIEMTPYTYISTAQCAAGNIRYNHIDGHYNQIFSGRAKNICLVHMGGRLNDNTGMAISKYDTVIEDCAHRVPVRRDKTGLVRIYSLYANKIITAGEGGLILTKDKGVYNYLRLLRNNGITHDPYHRKSPLYRISANGYKANLSDIHAAIVLRQIDHIPIILERRAEIAWMYADRLGVDRLPLHGGDNHHHLVICKVRAWRRARAELEKNKIGWSYHYVPIDNSFPALSVMSLPIYMGLKDREIKKICDILGGIE